MISNSQSMQWCYLCFDPYPPSRIHGVEHIEGKSARSKQDLQFTLGIPKQVIPKDHLPRKCELMHDFRFHSCIDSLRFSNRTQAKTIELCRLGARYSCSATDTRPVFSTSSTPSARSRSPSGPNMLRTATSSESQTRTSARASSRLSRRM